MSKVFEYFNEFNEGDEPCCEGDMTGNCNCGYTNEELMELEFISCWENGEELF